jgi:hypothetical protein
MGCNRFFGYMKNTLNLYPSGDKFSRVIFTFFKVFFNAVAMACYSLCRAGVICTDSARIFAVYRLSLKEERGKQDQCQVSPGESASQKPKSF